jgi:hypothetical protein
MSVSASSLGQVDSASALRCGFASLQPISIEKTVKKFGLKFRTVEWRFENKEEQTGFIKRYPTYMRFLNDSVMQKIRLPSRINPATFSAKLAEESVKEFNRDNELKSALGKVEGETNSARPFLEFVTFLRKRYNEKRERLIQTQTEMFMHSNLPFPFFTNLVMAGEIHEGFLDAVQRKTSLYENIWLRKYASNARLFGMKFQEMKDSLIPLFDVTEQNSFLQRCLAILVVASNCDSVDSLSSLEFTDIKKVDFEQFTQLSDEFRSSLDRCVSTILSMEPNAFSKIPTTDLNKAFSQMLIQ